MALGENMPEFRQATAQFQVMYAVTTGMGSEGKLPYCVSKILSPCIHSLPLVLTLFLPLYCKDS